MDWNMQIYLSYETKLFFTNCSILLINGIKKIPQRKTCRISGLDVKFQKKKQNTKFTFIKLWTEFSGMALIYIICCLKRIIESITVNDGSIMVNKTTSELTDVKNKHQLLHQL